jgi:signal transduction histidine kinase
MRNTPTPRLLLGLSLTLVAVAVFSLYALRQIEGVRRLQTDIIDRNRKDSLQLLRIQNNLHALGLAMRDMVDGQLGYPIEAWRGEFDRIRYDLQDAVRIDGQLASRPSEQQQYLAQSLQQFWTSATEVFSIAQGGEEERARKIIANSLQAQQAALASTVARLLVANNEVEEQAAGEIQRIYDGVEQNIYLFLSAMLVAVAAIGLGVIYYNRRIFQRMAVLSEQRSTLARRLIGVQEEVFRSVSRELHDEFGQILTAIGTMLQRAEKKGLPPGSPLREDVAEVKEIVQVTLEKTRSLSQALHPTVLDDYGLEKAMERYMPAFEKQTGITVRFEKKGSAPVPDEKAIHIYRVLQEALNNVAKHSQSSEASVRVQFGPERLRLEVEDHGVGMNGSSGRGLGLIAMRERAELLHGRLDIRRAAAGGTLVSLEVPLEEKIT